MMFADMHCDTLCFGYRDGVERIYDGEGMQSLRKMHAAGQLLQFFAVYFPGEQGFRRMFGKPDGKGGRLVPEDADFYREARQNLLTAVKAHSDIAAMAGNAADVRRNHAGGRVSAVLTIEDGRLLQGELTRLGDWQRDGVRAVGLLWNRENCLGYPNSADPVENAKGLKPFGCEAVEEMERLGMLVDVSHLNDGGTRDVLRIARRPFIASHSGARAVTSHPRNLPDELIRGIAEQGGIGGVNFFQTFAVPDGAADTETRVLHLVLHLQHMFRVGGEDYPAIGTDFDGFEGTPEIGRPEQMELLFSALSRAGFHERQIEKIAYGNVLRVMEELDGFAG